MSPNNGDHARILSEVYQIIRTAARRAEHANAPAVQGQGEPLEQGEPQRGTAQFSESQ